VNRGEVLVNFARFLQEETCCWPRGFLKAPETGRRGRKKTKILLTFHPQLLIFTGQSRKRLHRHPLEISEESERNGFLSFYDSGLNNRFLDAQVAQLVEHVLGKDEVISSILILGSIKNKTQQPRQATQTSHG
jgi:hypothetical protein